MTLRHRLGVVLLSLAIAGCVLLGTLGWFAVGFGVMTDCTNDYSCTSTGCPPCETTNRWINAGGLSQWALAAAALTALVIGIRRRRATLLLASGLAVLGLSAAVLVTTTSLAMASYCQPGTAGYEQSYCRTGD